LNINKTLTLTLYLGGKAIKLNHTPLPSEKSFKNATAYDLHPKFLPKLETFREISSWQK
jgi:hypothetical protein